MSVKIKRDKKMEGINVLFITQKLNDSILGFNATKNLVQNRNDTDLIVNLFQRVFGEVGRNKMETFVELIQQSKIQDKETEVKVKGKEFIIPSGKIVEVNRKINVDLIEKQRTTIFQQRDAELPEGTHCADSVVLFKPNIKSCFRIHVINDTNHYISIRKNLTIGHLEYVSSTVPLEMPSKTERNINKQKPSTINVLEISERSIQKMRKRIVIININQRYWKRLIYQD